MVNRVILAGNLGSDPELRHTESGTAVASMRIATNEHWTDKGGEKKERTEWHRVVVWGKQAEICKEHLAKGRPVLVEGRLRTRDYTDKENVKRYITEIHADRVQFLGSPTKNNESTEEVPFEFEGEVGF